MSPFLAARSELMAHATGRIGTDTYRTDIATGHHTLVADEGPELGGKDAGPAPYDLLISALAACTVITLRMYADRKEWPVTAVHADIHFRRDDAKVESIDRVLRIEGAVDAEQKKRMADIAERTPVTLTLKRSLEVRTRLA
jgi:putative redox protein